MTSGEKVSQKTNVSTTLTTSLPSLRFFLISLSLHSLCPTKEELLSLFHNNTGSRPDPRNYSPTYRYIVHTIQSVLHPPPPFPLFTLRLT